MKLREIFHNVNHYNKAAKAFSLKTLQVSIMEKGNLKEREYVASKEDVLNFIARKAYTHRNMRAAETEDWKKISSDEYQIVLDTATFFLILT